MIPVEDNTKNVVKNLVRSFEIKKMPLIFVLD